MSTLSSANVTDVNLVLKERTHMRLCINMLIFTHNLGNWLIHRQNLANKLILFMLRLWWIVHLLCVKMIVALVVDVWAVMLQQGGAWESGPPTQAPVSIPNVTTHQLRPGYQLHIILVAMSEAIEQVFVASVTVYCSNLCYANSKLFYLTQHTDLSTYRHRRL